MIKKKIIIWAGILFAQILLFYVLSSQEWAVAYHTRFFEWQKTFHITIFSEFPFSVGDVLYILIIGLILYFLIKIKTFSNKFLLLVNIFYFLYQVFWGMLYFQPAIKSYFPKHHFTQKEIESITYNYLNLCKSSREKLPEDRNGILIINNLKDIEESILYSQKHLPPYLRKNQIPNGAFKASIFGKLMNYTGIAGYYNPFTAEAQYNIHLPATHLPFTMAHENAHQLGFAREQEANFVGFLLGNQSENVALKYSTNWYALKSLLRFQRNENPDFVEKIMTEFSEGMQRDYMNERAFYEQYNGKAGVFFSFLNDIFLKSNQQEGSITYDYFVDLLLLHEKEKGLHSDERKPKNTNDEKIITPS